MSVRSLLLVCFIIFYSLLQCTIWEVNQDGSGDFITIQEGIITSADYDTVLVYPGIYYENLNMTEKNITLASLEMITSEPQYIDSTVIDGQMLGSCIILHNITIGATIRGFTIRNGFGTFLSSYDGGGVQIQCVENGLIENCYITDNHAAQGGAIFADITTLTLSGLRITENYAEFGGAACFDYGSELTFDPINLCNIYNNNASKGADLFAKSTGNIHVVVDTFTVFEPDRFFAEYYNGSTYTFDIQNYWMELIAHDLYVATDGDDSNSGFTPDEPLKTIAWAVRKIAADSLDPHTVYVAAGYYSWEENQQIFPLGCKNNVFLIGEDMHTTILNNDFSLRLINGFMNEGLVRISNFTLYNNFMIPNNVMYFRSIDQLEISNIKIDGNNVRNAIITEHVDNIFDNIIITNNVAEINGGFHLAGNAGIIRNCIADNNSLIQEPFYGHISSLLLDTEGDFVIENTIISNSTTYDEDSYTLGLYNGGGTDLTITMNNCLITGNNNTGERVICVSGNNDGLVVMNNCTIADNTSNRETILGLGNLTLRNTIMHNNTDYEVYMVNESPWGYVYELDVENCNIKNGIDGIYNEANANIINWGTGNISDDPLFDSLSDYPYTLQTGSICIDSGTPDTTGLFLPPWDLLNHERVFDGDEDGIAVIDMGCYEFGADSVGVNYNDLPEIDHEMYNYPNPFNPVTTINYCLGANVTDPYLEVYNIRGQRISELKIDPSSSYSAVTVNEGLRTGSVVWDGSGFASGIYFYRIKGDNFKSGAEKMILMK